MIFFNHQENDDAIDATSTCISVYAFDPDQCVAGKHHRCIFGTPHQPTPKTLKTKDLRTKTGLNSNRLASYLLFPMSSKLRPQQREQIEEQTMKTNRMSKTKSDQLPIDLNELISKIENLPDEYQTQLKPSLDRVIEYTRRRRRILNLIQEALSQLRLDMKYLMFDLESTRRERDEYKNALDGGI